MKQFLIVPALALALVACGSSDEAKEGTSVSINAKDKKGSDVVINADGKTGRVQVNVPGFNANVPLPKVLLDEADFDIGGVKLYPGSKVRSLDIVADESSSDKANVKVAFDAPANPDAVQNWFADAFADKSVDAAKSANGLTGTTSDGDSFSMTFAPDGAGATRGTIEIIG